MPELRLSSRGKCQAALLETMCVISRLFDVISVPNLLENRFRYRG
jgi:hypothetical protein